MPLIKPRLIHPVKCIILPLLPAPAIDPDYGEPVETVDDNLFDDSSPIEVMAQVKNATFKRREPVLNGFEEENRSSYLLIYRADGDNIQIGYKVIEIDAEPVEVSIIDKIPKSYYQSRTGKGFNFYRLVLESKKGAPQS